MTVVHLIVAIFLSSALVSGIEDTYVGAVVQFRTTPPGALTPAEYTNRTLCEMDPLVRSAAEKGADIVVFPEGILWVYARSRKEMGEYCEVVPDVQNGSPRVIPCESESEYSDRPVLREMSCMAKKYKITIVVNMASRMDCDDANPACPDDLHFQYNTNVAFSNDGAVLSRYHKHHEFSMVPRFDQAPLEIATFSTTFGVVFGMFICFDIEWAHPARDLFANGIRNIAYPTLWGNTPPQMTATMIQQGWSRTFNSNLLAANINNNEAQAGGGIFSAGESLTQIFSANEHHRSHHVLVATIPKNPSPLPPSPPPVSIPLSEVVQGDAVVAECGSYFSPLPLCSISPASPEKTISLSVSQRGVECRANITVGEKHDASRPVALLVNAGPYDFPGTPDTLYLSVCSVVHCSPNDNATHCHPDYSSSLRLASFVIESRFISPDIPVFFPLAAVGDNADAVPAAAFGSDLRSTPTEISTDAQPTGDLLHVLSVWSTKFWDADWNVFSAGVAVNSRP